MNNTWIALPRLRKGIALCVLASASVACGGSTPTSSGGSNADIAGTWNGTMAFLHMSNGSPVEDSQTVTFTLTQSAATVAGTWATSSGTVSKTGAVSGTTTATTFSGTLTATLTTIATGSSCTGTMTASGSAGAATMIWTSAAVANTNCSDPPTAITFAVVKQQ